MDDTLSKIDELIRRADALGNEIVLPFPDWATTSELERIATQGKEIGETWLADNTYVQTLRIMAAKCASTPHDSSGFTEWSILQKDLPITLKYLKQAVFFVATGQQDTPAINELNSLNQQASNLGFAGDSNKAEEIRTRAVNIAARLFGVESTFAAELRAFDFPIITATMFAPEVYDPYLRHKGELIRVLRAMRSEAEATRPNPNGSAEQSAQTTPAYPETYYHVRVVPMADTRQTVVELDLTADEVRDRIAEPYMSGDRLFVGGASVEPEEVRTIHIHRTDLPSDTPALREKAQIDRDNHLYIPRPPLSAFVAAQGKEVTKEFIKRPAPRRTPTNQATSEQQEPAGLRAAVKPLTLLIDVIALAFTLVWLVQDRTWEPALGLFLSLTGLVALVRVPPKYDYVLLIAVSVLALAILLAVGVPWITANFQTSPSNSPGPTVPTQTPTPGRTTTPPLETPRLSTIGTP